MDQLRRTKSSKHIWLLIGSEPEKVCDWEGRTNYPDDDGNCSGCIEAAKQWGWDRYMIAEALTETEAIRWRKSTQLERG